MVRWWQLAGTSTIGGGPVRRHAAPLAREEEDAKMGGIPIHKGILCAEILGDPYAKKSPLPRIGPITCLPVSPSIPSPVRFS